MTSASFVLCGAGAEVSVGWNLRLRFAWIGGPE